MRETYLRETMEFTTQFLVLSEANCLSTLCCLIIESKHCTVCLKQVFIFCIQDNFRWPTELTLGFLHRKYSYLVLYQSANLQVRYFSSDFHYLVLMTSFSECSYSSQHPVSLGRIKLNRSSELRMVQRRKEKQKNCLEFKGKRWECIVS